MKTAIHNIHQELIDRCKANDRQAQYEVYKLYSKSMYNLACRMARNTAEAEDILQEAFVSCFKHIQSYNGTATFGAWLKRIVINKAISTANKNKLEFAQLDQAEEQQEEGSDENAGDYQLEQVRMAVDQLPDGYRVVFSLYALEGYDHVEIAEILGVSESTSKSQYNRAKKKLKDILKKGVVYEG